jgi:hypothetical protein
MTPRVRAVSLTLPILAYLLFLSLAYTNGQADDLAMPGSTAATADGASPGEDAAVAGANAAMNANPRATYKKDTLVRGKSGFEALKKKDKNKVDVIAEKHGKSAEELEKEMTEDGDLAIDPEYDNLMYICEGLAVDGVVDPAGVIVSSVGEGPIEPTDVVTASTGITSAFVDSQVSTAPGGSCKQSAVPCWS